MITNAKSGHPGIVLSAAPILYTLYANHLNINTSDKNWYNRDRFIMSAGHGSALLYATLFMSGYNISLEDLKQFRKIGSKTPGHPELNITPGVECTTGPLGQGIATAVGIALGEKILSNNYKCPSGKSLFNFKTYVLVGDGDLMEGISYEACSFAGSMNLKNLIILYDSNNMSLDGSTTYTFKEDVRKRFKSFGFKTYLIKNGNDLKKLNFILNLAKRSSKPVFIEIKTKLGNGSLLENTNSVHGKPLTNDDIIQLKQKLKVPTDLFYVNDNSKSYMQNKIANRVNKVYTESVDTYKEYVDKVLNGNKNRINYLFNNNIQANILNFNWQLKDKQALRDTNQYILKTILDNIPIVIGGSADLGSSTMTYIKELEDLTSHNLKGKNIWFGVREQAMGAILNGLALVNFHPYGSTFLSFSDYVKPSIRMSALMNLPVTYIFTHDSISIGSDGPTHQPVEQLLMLRSLPNLDVFRPADANETIGSYKTILEKGEGPSAILLGRNTVPILEETKVNEVEKGGYIALDTNKKPDGIVISSGEELHQVLEVAKRLKTKGIEIRVVSMPNLGRFLKQSDEYIENILPVEVRKIVVEAGSSYSWNKLIFNQKYLITLDTFGTSGKCSDVYKKYGFDAASLEEKIEELLK